MNLMFQFSFVARFCLLLLLLCTAGIETVVFLDKLNRHTRFLSRLPDLILSVLLLLFLSNLVLVHITIYRTAQQDFFPLCCDPPSPVLWGISVSVFLYALFILWRQAQQKRGEITLFSIQEAFNNLPAATAFFRENGLPLLVNHRMDTLIRQALGYDIQSEAELWHALTQQTLQNGITRLRDTPLTLQFPGGIWQFSRTDFLCVDEPCTQLLAVDCTDLYHLSEALQKHNLALANMETQLHTLLGNFAALQTETEVLQAKIQVHNDIGHSVLTTRRFLENGCPETQAQDVLQQWKQVIGLLARESTRSENSALEQFYQAAQAIGISVKLQGRLPEDRRTAYLLIAAMRECLTNAVRHAGATEIAVCLTHTPTHVMAEITNNGVPPDGPIAEGGGLGNLRSRMERVGGTMSIESQPVFVLRISLPTQREEEAL